MPKKGLFLILLLSFIPITAGAAELYDYSQLGPDPLRDLVAELGLSTSTMTGETVILDGRILATEHGI